ncbi:hypothetical protein AK973_5658 [Pseudomonas brassicacearum]|nr:hypothetical protein AK973_5658 [Pseudomonas brassicacearum]
MAKNAHDVTSLDTWSRCRINQSMLDSRWEPSCRFTPQNAFKNTGS